MLISGLFKRQNGLHELLRELIGRPFVGPVQGLLARAPGEQRRVLDLGTGTGCWCADEPSHTRLWPSSLTQLCRVLEMAQRFPHVRFYGVDIGASARRMTVPPRFNGTARLLVPIATRYPPTNVMFEMHDIRDRSRYEDGSIDMVHARFINLVVNPSLLPKVPVRPWPVSHDGALPRFATTPLSSRR